MTVTTAQKSLLIAVTTGDDGSIALRFIPSSRESDQDFNRTEQYSVHAIVFVAVLRNDADWHTLAENDMPSFYDSDRRFRIVIRPKHHFSDRDQLIKLIVAELADNGWEADYKICW